MTRLGKLTTGTVLILFIFLLIFRLDHVSPSIHPSSSTNPKPAKNIIKKQSILPTPKHIVVVIEENHNYDTIIGNQEAPYINQLAHVGTLFTNAHGVTHPSQPNYLALFSGDTQGISSDRCPHTLKATNIASELRKVGLSFIGYSEGLPRTGNKDCQVGAYFRKHNPWSNFSNVPSSLNQPFKAFSNDFSKLPTLSFVIPNQKHDMHDGTIKQADTWLKDNLDSYVQWAINHQSLLILTWDEDDFKKANHIPMIFLGQMVKSGSYTSYVNHYDVLKTLEDMYQLPYIGKTATGHTIIGIWN